MTRRRFPSAAVLALGFAVGGCSLAAGVSGAGGDLGVISQARRQVESSYVVPAKTGQRVNGGLKGMRSRRAPHSDFMSETEYGDGISTTGGERGRDVRE